MKGEELLARMFAEAAKCGISVEQAQQEAVQDPREINTVLIRGRVLCCYPLNLMPGCWGRLEINAETVVGFQIIGQAGVSFLERRTEKPVLFCGRLMSDGGEPVIEVGLWAAS